MKNIYCDENDIIFCRCRRKCGVLDRKFGNLIACLTNVRECIQTLRQMNTDPENTSLCVMTAEIREISRESALPPTRVLDVIDLTNTDRIECVDLTDDSVCETVIRSSNLIEVKLESDIDSKDINQTTTQSPSENEKKTESSEKFEGVLETELDVQPTTSNASDAKASSNDGVQHTTDCNGYCNLCGVNNVDFSPLSEGWINDFLAERLPDFDFSYLEDFDL